MISLFLFTAVTVLAQNSQVQWDYLQHGQDWGKLEDPFGEQAYPLCVPGRELQSPIDLSDTYGLGSH